MFIAKILIEHPVQSLDMTFDYLSNYPLQIGIRVLVHFDSQKSVGYIENIKQTSFI